MRRVVGLVAALAATVLLAPYNSAQTLPVIPGAFGFGMSTRAAYACTSSPTIYRVQNLNDSGANSLREGVESSTRGRVIIFEVSGTIVLQSDLNVLYPCLTIAGQTAPSPGITIRGADNAGVSAGGLLVHAHDVLIQHIRIRPGDGGPVLFSTSGHEATNIYDQGYYTSTGEGVYNVVFDHLSISWAGAKLTTLYAIQNGANTTFWKNIYSEALYRAKNVTDDWASRRVTSLAMALGDANGINYNTTLYGNLFAHNSDRNPELGSGDNVQIINNVFYDWGKDIAFDQAAALLIYVPNGSQPWLADNIGNVYITGPGTGPFSTYQAVWVYSGNSGSAYYLTDTVLDSTVNPLTLLDDHAANSYGTPFRVFSPTMSTSGYTILAGSATKAFVLSNAGARPADRDAVDRRVVSEVTSHSAVTGNSCPNLPDPAARVSAIPGRLCSQTDAGGWPTLAQNTRSLSVPSNPHTVTGSGYTNLENWLHGYASGVEGGATGPPNPPINVHIVH